MFDQDLVEALNVEHPKKAFRFRLLGQLSGSCDVGYASFALLLKRHKEQDLSQRYILRRQLRLYPLDLALARICKIDTLDSCSYYRSTFN